MKRDAVFPLAAQAAGLYIVTLWLTLAAAVLLFLFAPIALWVYLLLVPGLGLLFLLLVRLAFGNLRVELRGNALAISRGTIFQLRRVAPLSTTLELWRLRTPLLRSFGCCVAVLHLPGSWLLLPGLSEEGCDALQKCLQRSTL